MWHRAQGNHHSTISAYHESKSISTENTFEENITDVNKLMSEIVRMTEKIAFELRKEEKVAGCVTVKSAILILKPPPGKQAFLIQAPMMK